MRIPGFCTSCHKIKQVQVSNHGLTMMQATRSVAQGVCASCQDAEDKKRKERRESR